MKTCSSTHDGTAYIVSNLSRAIANGELDKRFHVTLDDAYKCSDQESTPYKGRNLEVPKDANYYESLHRQPSERTFG